MEKGCNCIAVSDLHGDIDRYNKLFKLVAEEKPAALFIAGDITGGYYRTHLGEDLEEFIDGYLKGNLLNLKNKMQEQYPEIFIILGNDDPGYLEKACKRVDQQLIWHYMHNRCIRWKELTVCGYSYVPPTPFQMKDWEKYDVSRYVDVGAVPPTAGFRTVKADPLELEWGTIKRDLDQLTDDTNIKNTIFLFHSPPYKTLLDRAALDGKMVDHAPLDVHVGSIAIKNFITRKQPLLSIHGHVHESTSITGSWKDKCGRTMMFNPAHQGKELSVIYFSSTDTEISYRQLF